MDEAIKFLNVEIGVFLRYLRCFSTIENVQINELTVQLMQEANSIMRQMVQTATIIGNSAKNDVSFIFDLDENQYKLQRNIICNKCNECFPLSKCFYLEHVQRKHYCAISTGSDSCSSDFIPENESTMFQPDCHSITASPNSSDGDLGFADGSSITQHNESMHPRYSDIVRSVAPKSDPKPAHFVEEKAVSIPITLGDFIRTNNCSEAISSQLAEFTTPNDQRTKTYTDILDKLKQSVRLFDPALKVVPFGSVTYGINGSKTNYNILIDTRKSGKSPANLLRSFQNYTCTPIVKGDFDFVGKIDTNRVLKQQLQLIHKKSRIECLLLFDNDIGAIDSAKAIKDLIALMPICRQLIAYIRAWQNVINGPGTQSGHKAFQFNTYIISVLVVFFLQMNYNLPTVADASILAASVKSSPGEMSNDDKKDFNRMLLEFFHFYGSRYEINNHLISARIGRWQEQRLTGQQKHFTPEQKRLRDAISLNAANWKNCTMFVQDLVVPGLNITAEMPKEEVYNFQEMCQMFSRPHIVSPNKRVPRAIPLVNTKSSTNCKVLQIALNRAKPIKGDKPKPDADATAPKKVVVTKKPTVKTDEAILDDAFKNGTFFEKLQTELTKITTPCHERISNESRILRILKSHFKTFDRTLVLIPFGSSTYGFANAQSNFNIFVDSRKSQQVPALVLESFEKYLAKTDLHQQFDGIAEIPASRTLKHQMRMVHKETGISVLLLVDDFPVTEPSKIIRDFLIVKPICQQLIEYIVAWQTTLRSILAENGSTEFKFNTYLISILVIFFMQVNYGVATIQEMASFRSNAEAMRKVKATHQKDVNSFDKILVEFFWFYGNRYQIWNHVLSLNIGRWQERRIQNQTKNYLPTQKRLRDGISSNPANWKNCTMYVEDLVRSGINVAAEITSKDAYAFKEMCQIFAKKNICQKMCNKDKEDE